MKEKPEFTEVHKQDRTYHLPGGENFTLKDVISIHVSESGTHRLNLDDGTKAIVPFVWCCITFKAKDWTF